MISKLQIDYSTIKNLPNLLEYLRQKKVNPNHYWNYVEEYQEHKARCYGIPLHGQFELTPLCNLECKMCYVHLNNEQVRKTGSSILSVQQWKNIMQQAHLQGMLYVSLTGGECLTYPGFMDLYMYLKSLGCKIGIKTNGVLLDNKLVQLFKSHPPIGITVSLYGSSNASYKKVTGQSVFDVVYNNLLSLKNNDIRTNIAITPSRYLYEDLPDTINVARRLELPFSVNAILFPPRKETEREMCDLTITEYVELYKKLKSSNLGKLSLFDENDLVSLPRCEKDIVPRYGIQCGAGRSSFFVNWKGKITACNNLNSLEINLLDKPFSEAWKTIYNESLGFSLPSECSTCAYERVCFNCVAFRGLNAEKGHCNPKICERTKLFFKEGIYQ